MKKKFRITVRIEVKITRTIRAKDEVRAVALLQKQLKGKRIKIKRRYFEEYPTILELS